jgi:hypothetical protein
VSDPGSSIRRNTGKALGPLLVGIALFPLFFVWESRMDPFDALIDPKIWRIRNVLLISIISLVPYFWCASFLLYCDARLGTSTFLLTPISLLRRFFQVVPGAGLVRASHAGRLA